jgi:DNA polymerase epsilon subunit 1
VAAPGGAAGNLGAYLRQQAKAVSRSTWQVLQVAPTRAAGEYRLWVVADGGLYAVPLRVPRRLVVNSSLPAGSPGVEVLGEPTKALLPAADVPLNLYEVRGGGYWGQGARVAEPGVQWREEK